MGPPGPRSEPFNLHENTKTGRKDPERGVPFLPMRRNTRARVGDAACVRLGTLALTLLGMAGVGPADAQEDARPTAGVPPSLVVDHPVFTPVVPPAAYLRAVENGTRTPDGRPGANYWQQRVDYTIRASLQPETARLSGSEVIRYTNRAPSDISRLFVHLYQNVFSEGVERNRSVRITGGMEIGRVAAQGRTLDRLTPGDLRSRDRRAGYLIDGSVAHVILPDPIPSGGVAELEFEWEYTIPGADAFRTGHIDNRIFNVAQWYPQIAVVDDVYGFDASPYLGDGEFYLEYGSFDVSLTVPDGWLVAATGELQNAPSLLPEAMRRRLARALRSDETIRIGSGEDLAPGTPIASGRTWHFRAEQVRDFAFATSDRYVWDAVGAVVGGDQGRTLVQAMYDPALEHWRDAAAFSKHSIEFFSRYILPYPYPHATAAYGPIGGMEYPMLVFIGRSRWGEPLYSVLAHEFSHEWFPMIVGSREAAFAWMDEGFTSFNEALAREEYFGNRNARMADQDRYLQVARAEVEAPLMQHTDYVESGLGRGVATYTKPATLMHALRRILGEETFDRAYRDYAGAWSYRHPYPWDFFRLMESEGGEDLDWFWRAWFYDTVTLDQSIETVDQGEGALNITITNRGGAVMPVEIQLHFEDGSSERVTWPVDAWAGTRRVTRRVTAPHRVVKIVLDPERFYPDIDRTNNVWPTDPSTP